MSPFLKASLYFTAAGISAYWGAVFFGVFPIIELVPGYRSWFMSFPIADFWIAITSIFAVVLASFEKQLSAIAMAAAGSGLIFLGLYAFAYGFNSGLVYELTDEELIEIGIKIYCLAMGAWLLLSAYLQISEPRKTSFPSVLF